MAQVSCLDGMAGNGFAAYQGDCVDVLRQFPDNSIDFSVYSPPFSGLYIYNDSLADMGNSATDEEFVKHYDFLAHELMRVMRPGRLIAVHCKDLVFYRTQRGTAGLRDLPGMLIRSHENAGFTFHSRVTIWRDPVREMTKTKAHGLLYKQLRADASFSRQGLPEYFVVFRKWADDESTEVSAVQHVKLGDDPGARAIAAQGLARTGWSEESAITEAAQNVVFPLPQWQEWASPVWMKTRETDVLNARRDAADEKHICPMPLDLTERAVTLWSNPGDVVLSPFMGIGSEGVVSLKLKRRFVGIELKETYFRQACRHLDLAERNAVGLFDQPLAAE